jgi:hypothetical protein
VIELLTRMHCLCASPGHNWVMLMRSEWRHSASSSCMSAEVLWCCRTQVDRGAVCRNRVGLMSAEMEVAEGS